MTTTTNTEVHTSDTPLKEPGCFQVVLLRHGESEWNASKRFSGWVDVDLTEKGRKEAIRAGKLLRMHGFEFDEAHSSMLKRAVRTMWTALHSTDFHWIPVKHTWRLNERHYGALTGLSKTEAEKELGKDMLLRYRRGYDTPPMPMDESHPYWTGNDRRYNDLGDLLPRGESLKQCKQRILPYWDDSIVPAIRAGRNVLIAAHNNVIRCLCKHLDEIPTEHLRDLEIPTGAPIVYNLDKETLKPVGTPDKFGFRGRYIQANDDELDVPNPLATVVKTSDVVSVHNIQSEAERLGISPAQIRCINEAERASDDTDNDENGGDPAPAAAPKHNTSTITVLNPQDELPHAASGRGGSHTSKQCSSEERRKASSSSSPPTQASHPHASHNKNNSKNKAARSDSNIGI